MQQLPKRGMTKQNNKKAARRQRINHSDGEMQATYDELSPTFLSLRGGLSVVELLFEVTLKE